MSMSEERKWRELKRYRVPSFKIGRLISQFWSSKYGADTNDMSIAKKEPAEDGGAGREDASSRPLGSGLAQRPARRWSARGSAVHFVLVRVARGSGAHASRHIF